LTPKKLGNINETDARYPEYIRVIESENKLLLLKEQLNQLCAFEISPAVTKDRSEENEIIEISSPPVTDYGRTGPEEIEIIEISSPPVTSPVPSPEVANLVVEEQQQEPDPNENSFIQFLINEFEVRKDDWNLVSSRLRKGLREKVFSEYISQLNSLYETEKKIQRATAKPTN